MESKIRLFFFLGVSVFLAAGWYFLTSTPHSLVQAAGPEGLIRLHILANSDSAGDQQLKLKVRDAVVAYLTPKLSNVKKPEQARTVILDNQEELLAIAKGVIRENGAEYSARIETGWFDFPLRSYGAVVVPAGRYEAVRILLGEAKGKNWWCVLFPPLCFVDGSGAVAVPAGAGEFKKGKVEIRWKLAELIQGL
ncbi:MAG: stage sporulation protein [Firmicutes bacterium]|nr:stage sporulation protein [Bacillota bacterium]